MCDAQGLEKKEKSGPESPVIKAPVLGIRCIGSPESGSASPDPNTSMLKQK
jgi:hypothetical protein